MIKILFLTNLPSPYMVDFFNELGKQCQLTVVFERSFSSERNGRWNHYQFQNFEGIILKGMPMSPDSALSLGVFKYLNRKHDYIIVSNPMTPTGIIAIEYMRIRRLSYIIESEGSFPKSGRGIKERFKRHIIRNAYAYFSTTEKADEYFWQYGADKERIYHYPFTSLHQKDILQKPLSKAEKLDLRKRLGLSGNKIAIAVGRLIPLKRYDDLIHAWSKMPLDWHLIFVGEGEEQQNLQKLVCDSNMENVFFLGYKEKTELFELYKAADLFVHPTSTDVWGLVINEAMACGLPVITTKMCIAGEALVSDGENGYIVEVGDIKALEEKIYVTLKDEGTLAWMAQESVKKIAEYTFEKMAQVHIDLLKELR